MNLGKQLTVGSWQLKELTALPLPSIRIIVTVRLLLLLLLQHLLPLGCRATRAENEVPWHELRELCTHPGSVP